MSLMSTVFYRMTTARIAIAVICLFIGATAATAGGGQQLRPTDLTALIGGGSSLPNSSWAGLSARSTTATDTKAPAIDPAILASAPNGPDYIPVEPEAPAPAVDPYSVPQSANGLGPDPEKTAPGRVRLDPTDFPPSANLNGAEVFWGPVSEPITAAQESSFPTSSTTTSKFPRAGDNVQINNDPFWFNAGDYVEGVRNTAFSTVNAVGYALSVSNGLNSGAQVDFDLSVNGSVVGSFSVLEGEVFKSLFFTFPAIAGPNYTIRLEETNTVPGGQGSIQIALDVSDLTLYDTTDSPYFPATGDVVDATNGNVYWNTGDYAEGVRKPGLASINAVDYQLDVTNNVLNSGAQVDFDLSINGTVVGSFTVLEGETAKSLDFVFPPIAGPNYTVRLEETNTVPGGQGSVEIGLDVSDLTLYVNTASPYFPATGDVVDATNGNVYWNTGDYAEGVRKPGLASINAVDYQLDVTNNVLNSGAQVDFDLSINGTVVGSFAVLEGETAKSLQFVFPPIAGPVYTVRLEETNTVPSGQGSVEIGLDVSELTFYDNATSHYFPATGDIYDVNSLPDYFWVLNDEVTGIRAPGLASVNAATYLFKSSLNYLSSSGHVDLDLSINGTVVGSFVVDVGEDQESHTFVFPPIAGPVYTVRLTATNTVDPGFGAVVVPVEFSELYLYDNAPVAVGDGEGSLRTGLHAAAPNPFHEQMRIDFDLASGGNVGLYVYDAAGRRVATLAQGQYAAGRHVAVWNGRDEHGVSARAGTYFVKLVTSDATSTRKIVHID